MKTRLLATIGLVLLAASTTARGQTTPPQGQTTPPQDDAAAKKDDTSTAKQQEGWQFSLAPYFWAPSVNGSVHVRGIDVDVNESFNDIWDALTFGGMMKAEARKERFGVFTDVMYVALKDDSDITLRNGTDLFNIQSKLYLWVADVAGFYEVSRWDMGSPREKGSFDVFAGGRLWSIETKINASSPILDTSRSASDTTAWVDPIVGGRVGLDLSQHFALLVQGDIGGFDIGNSSKLTWSTEAYLGWRFNEAISAWAGWKYLWVDHDNVRVDLSGPVVGMAFRF